VKELDAAVADSLGKVAAGSPKPHPPPGTTCLNCGAPLHGRYCHVCGQSGDTHRRTIGHLIAESLEGLLHFDSRFWRTLPDLLFRPGRLAHDYMEGRVARHVPPFRTFLVALLLFIFAGEYAAHQIARETERQSQARAEALKTPQGRAKEVVRIRGEAEFDRVADLKDAEAGRQEDLKDPDDKPVRIQARYARKVAAVQARYAAQMAKADRVANGQPPAPTVALTVSGRTPTNRAFWKDAVRKAIANPESYLAVMFAWGHRVAFLLLPIVGLTLALVYVNRRRYLIYDHLLVAMNFLSFVFLANALGLVLPLPLAAIWLSLVAIWTPINLFQSLRGAYGSSVPGAAFKTLVVWSTSFFAFFVLLGGLLVFSLIQL
jgi:hypothetical protein